MRPVWEGSYRVRRDEVGEEGLAGITTLLNFLQDGASHHARDLGVSIEHLATLGQAWVLRAVRLLVSRYPEWGREVTVRTWPTGVQRLQALRDYLILDAAGEIGRAASAWLIIDRDRRRPVRLPTEWADFEFLSDRAFDEPIPSPPAIRSPAGWARVMVQPWDLDFNGHVNHIRYLEWLLGAVRTEPWGRLQATDLAAHFHQEAMAGDALLLAWGEGVTDGSDTVVDLGVTRESDGVALVTVRIRWRQV